MRGSRCAASFLEFINVKVEFELLFSISSSAKTNVVVVNEKKKNSIRTFTARFTVVIGIIVLLLRGKCACLP